MSIIDQIVLAAYFLVVVFIGFYFSKKNTSTEEYFVGGRSFSGWVVGLSLVGTSISSISFLAYPADAYKTAWLRYLPNLMLPIAVVIAAYLFLPFFRRNNGITAYEYLEHRFGPSIRVYAAVAFLIGQVVRISLILYLLAILVSELTQMDMITAIVVAGIFVGLYTIIGGIDAVIWTDVLQTVVLVLGGILCLVVIVNQLPGGLGQIIEVANQEGKLAFSEWREGELFPINWELTWQTKTGTMMLLFGLSIWLTEYSGNQNTVQRFCASKSDADARQAMFVCALSSLPIWAFYMFLGTALYVFFQVFPDPNATQMLTGEQKAEQILPYFIQNYLPIGMVGLVIAAALSAAMSSLDSSINAISTVLVVDIYKRFAKKKEHDKHYLNVAKLIALISSLVMIIGAILLMKADTKTLQHMATILVSILSGGILGIYLLGFFTQKGDARSIWVGIIFTICFTIWTLLVKNQVLESAPFDLYYTGILGNILMFLIGYFASLLFIHRPVKVGYSLWNRKE